MSDTRMTAAFFAEALGRLGAVHTGDPAAPILDGAADSRLVKPGDLFAGFRGETHDGNDYLETALERGAVAIVGEREPRFPAEGRSWAVVPDSRVAMASLAASWRQACSPRVVGITGTVGKTTAKEFTAAVLARFFRTHRSKENFNSREGLPLAMVSLRRDHEVSVLEMAMDSPGEIAELCAIARPEVGIVLNIGYTHAAKLGSIDAIASEKLSLARSLDAGGSAILNADDPRVAAAAPELACKVLTFGGAAGATLRRGPIRDLGLDGCAFDVAFGGQTRGVRTPLPGAHVVPAALSAIASALALGVPLNDAADAVETVDVRGRMVVIRAGGLTILDDRYNSSPASLEGALRLLAGLDGRRVAVLGTMAELGEREGSEHGRLGTIAATCCDLLMATGAPCRELVASARRAGLAASRWFESKEALAEALPAAVAPGDTILVKASRGLAFETLIPILEQAP